jgi:hypothetical protein
MLMTIRTASAPALFPMRYKTPEKKRRYERDKYHNHTPEQRAHYYGRTLRKGQRGRDHLADWYIRKVAALNAGVSALEVTPEMMRRTRASIEGKRSRRIAKEFC